MKLSTRVRYAARAMVELALGTEQTPVSAGEIVARQGISKKYLQQILATLQAAGLVIALRGRSGGYQLTRHPGQITMREVYEAIEPSGGLVPCTFGQPCERSTECVLADVWKEMFQAMMGVLEETTLADLADRARAGQGQTYTI